MLLWFCYLERFSITIQIYNIFRLQLKIFIFIYMFRKHSYFLLLLIVLGIITYILEYSNTIKFDLSIYPLIISFFSLLILVLKNSLKKQVYFSKIIFFLNSIYILKFIIFDSSTELYGYLYLAIITLIMALIYKSLKRDKDLIDSVDRLR